MGPKSTYGAFAPQIGVKMWADRDGMHRFGVITLRGMYILCFFFKYGFHVRAYN